MAFDPTIRWHLPEGEPPYTTAAVGPDERPELVLYNEMKRMYIFLHGPYPTQRVGNNPDDRKKMAKMREFNFIQILQNVAPDDAKLLLAVKDQRVQKLYPGVDKELIQEAYPDLGL